MKGFQLVLFLILLRLQGGKQVKATETSSIHPDKETEKKQTVPQRKEVWIKAKISRDPPPPPSTAGAALSRRWFAAAGRHSGMIKPKKRRNRQGKDPEPLKENNKGDGRSTSPPWDQGGRKQVRCVPQEECSKKKKEKKVEGEGKVEEKKK